MPIHLWPICSCVITLSIHLRYILHVTLRVRRSTNPELDGEGAELQTSSLALALEEVGDDRFSAVLSRQESAVQKEVTDSIRNMWRHYGLKYPKTRAIHAKFKSRHESDNLPSS
jgi:hypothetical protein